MTLNSEIEIVGKTLTGFYNGKYRKGKVVAFTPDRCNKTRGNITIEFDSDGKVDYRCLHSWKILDGVLS